MKKMILWTVVLLGPLTWTTTAQAIFGIPDVAALAQRVTIIANQGIQIGHAVSGLSRATEQFNKLKEQYDHLREQALGEIGALTAPLTEIAALPGQLVGAGLSWRDDFTNTDAAGLVDALDLFSNDGQPLTEYWRGRLSEAPAVTEQQVLAEYSTLPVGLADRAAENYRRDAAVGARRTAVNHTVNDAAALATSTVKSALASFAALRGQTNASGTALQQAQVAGLITNGEVTAALAQLLAFQATQQTAQALEAETRRRERAAARLAIQEAAREDYDRRLAGIDAHRDGGDALLFVIR